MRFALPNLYAQANSFYSLFLIGLTKFNPEKIKDIK